ncbi:MAG: 50S ribosomal protein L11 methyltransferase [Verrucomicrobia bacterium CG_4_10_14_3_um_filter_43_23]|nr:MAG: hypothetical protein AUJ82_02820 [Verrucomicrobia bacterium CG1_02_43_26]PIP59191.1 MAG: 50S ribosomal protein L11 methyltransferase [Verrucomicrobia bacterium CG22_combo_CG10-13_8_21_14_all_43_17]PIX58467.1 MAG: 50S ribosomal protein L11 methyltransferase [Verrucomicrobia bacterium CG_4_10_14_3_um_filter_43_23]PIY63191.1 MAG: 50S ribosomal protein L11 methyltransferase [Verrucomicrobia bacterium CG_4_10_14_0_8_um_filter_43_34]PJA44910.1 MAG: 50S ribosomal protein L11 methyltransferase 
MVEVYAEIDSVYVDALEEIFFEEDAGESRWVISQKTNNDPYVLQGFFDSIEEARLAWGKLNGNFEQFPTPQFRQIKDEDWQNSYKAFLKPWHCGPIHWVPVWEEGHYNIPANEHAIWMDAGMAFGTGTHETTQLCAMRLVDIYRNQSKEALSQLSLVDAGCGTGILAMTAKLLGFGKVAAFDNDIKAITVAQENLEYNHLAGQLELFHADLISGFAGRKADFIVANILAHVLNEYAENLLQALNPKGVLILSGILTREIELVHARFSETANRLGIACKLGSRELGEWSDLLLELS